ncbi:putative bifunctional dTTP/UTP pyrophosphatase/methyltransferase protein [Glandiceps talaboti]
MAEALDVWGDIHKYIITQALITACKLRLFDNMKDNKVSSSDLAKQVDGDETALKHVLYALASMGYLSVHRDQDGELFTNTDKANKYLVTSSPSSLLPVALSREKSYVMFGNMMDAVKEGKLLKLSAGDRFREMADDQQKRTGFLQSMDSMVKNFRAPVLMSSFDFSDYVTVCDLGGCTGGLSYSLAAAYPNMKIIVLDLPNVVSGAEQYRPAHGCENVTFQASDMLKDELPKVDMFLLASIIHDWPMDKVHLILNRVFEALNPGGAVVIVETLFDEKREESNSESHLFSLHMSMLGGGKQWSGLELKECLTGHGFTDVKIHKSDLVYGVVMATKK